MMKMKVKHQYFRRIPIPDLMNLGLRQVKFNCQDQEGTQEVDFMTLKIMVQQQG
jgi:hypothetical protein